MMMRILINLWSKTVRNRKLGIFVDHHLHRIQLRWTLFAVISRIHVAEKSIRAYTTKMRQKLQK